nr:hypothetical protein [Tanacetum cinerariifolium]
MIGLTLIPLVSKDEFTHISLPLTEVIEFRDSYEAPDDVVATGSATEETGKKKGRTVALTTKDTQKRKNDVKERTTLLLVLLDEHQLRFQGSKTLEQTFNRLQAIVSQLEFMDIEIEQDDPNQKFLTGLAPEWLMHTIIWRNIINIDTLSLDDLYNHLKVGKKDVNTASIPTASINVFPASVNIRAIDEDDIEEMDIKWNMALLSMRADRFWKKTGKKISIQGTDMAGFDKSKVECFNCHKMGHFAREYKAPRSQDRGRRDNYRQGSKVEELTPKALMAIAGAFTCYRSTSDDVQNRNSSETEASPSTILSKPFIKFVKATDRPTKNKTVKDETVKKPVVKHFPTVNRKFPTINRKFPTGNKKFSTANLGNKGKAVKTSACWIWKLKQNTSNKGNISYLSDYEPFDGGYVSFGQGGCKITGKGTIKTGKLEFGNVYFMKDLKYNLFSVSQICDNKNSVLFTDSECIMLGRDFKLRDDTNVLLRTPRQHNMYSINLNNIVPHKDLTYLVAKASADECMLWHRRLGHLNIKTMNRTPQQNGVAEKRNRTLIEAARTMLADAKLLVTFWAEAVNTACTKDVASEEVKKDVSSLRYIALPNWVHDALLESTSSNAQDTCKADAPESSGNPNPTAFITNPLADPMETLAVETLIPTLSSLVPTACLNDSLELSSDTRLISKRVTSQDNTPSLDNILTLTNIFDDILGVTIDTDDTHGEEADIGNMEKTITASLTPTLKIHKEHPKSQIIDPVDTPVQTRTKSKEMEEHSFIAIIHQMTNLALLQFCLFSCFLSQVEPKNIFDALQDLNWMDVKSAFLYGTIDEEVCVMQPPGFQDPEFPERVYKVEKAMYGLHQAPRAWLLCREFKALMHEKIQMSAMGELNFFLGLQVLQKEDDLFLSQDKPDIMFAVCTRARHQVTPKECHPHVVKRIFRYLKGHPKLGLWYPKESPFDLVAYSDSDYGGATQDRKSTTGGCQFLGRRLISWQCRRLSMPCEALSKEISSSILILQYTRRARIAQSSALPPVADKPTSPIGDDSQGEACPTNSGLEVAYNKANITKTSTLPSDSTPRVTSLAADEEINSLKARIKLLEDKHRGVAKQSGDDAPIKGKRVDEEEEAAKRVSDDTKEMGTVLTSMDAASILTSGGVQVVPTATEVATATVSIPTGSGVVSTASLTIPTAALIFTTATESTPYIRRKRKEKMVESDTPKKKKLQEQIDISRDAEIARIHVEEELKIMIDGLDWNNETVAKYLQEYHQFATELPIGRRIDLISDLVKYQDNYAKVLKY